MGSRCSVGTRIWFCFRFCVEHVLNVCCSCTVSCRTLEVCSNGEQYLDDLEHDAVCIGRCYVAIFRRDHLLGRKMYMMPLLFAVMLVFLHCGSFRHLWTSWRADQCWTYLAFFLYGNMCWRIIAWNMRTFTDVSILELMPFQLNSPEFFRINTSFFRIRRSFFIVFSFINNIRSIRALLMSAFRLPSSQVITNSSLHFYEKLK